MFIQIAAATAAIMAADTHKDRKELAVLDVDGPFIVLNFGPDATVDSARESIRSMDTFVGGLIAESDDDAEIAQLSALKAFIVSAERDVEREYAYIMNAPTDAEANSPDAESQLHSEQHTAINDSSSSNGADSNTNEELNTDGETQESPRSRRKR